MTLHTPYYLASNGFFAAWLALASSWKLATRHFEWGQLADAWVSSPWGAIWLASALQVMQTSVIYAEDYEEEDTYSTRAKITDRHGILKIDTVSRWSQFSEEGFKITLIIIGVISFVCLSACLLIGFFTHSRSDPRFKAFCITAAVLLLAAWSLAVVVATFDYPYRYAGNGYFACWAAWAASAALLPKNFRVAGAAWLSRFGAWPALPALLASSVVVLAASARWCTVYTCDRLTQWAVACSALSAGVALLAMVATPCGSARQVFLPVGIFLVLLWVPGTWCMTLHRPFKMMGNGFAGAWVSLLAAWFVTIEHVPDKSWFSRLDRDCYVLAAVLAASTALVGQSAVDCGERPTCPWPWGRAIMFGVGSFPMTIFGVGCKLYPQLRHLLRYVAVAQFVWWCAGLVFVTFMSPYTVMGTAYVACWAAFGASGLLVHTEWRPATTTTSVRAMKAGEVSCEVCTNVQCAGNASAHFSVAKEYEGHFSHPGLGPGSTIIRVDLKSPTAGRWVYLGDTEDVALKLLHGRVHISNHSKAMIFDGVVGGNGVIRGDVTYSGVKGGSFDLSPKMISLLPSFCSTKSSLNTVHVTKVTDQAKLDKIQELFDKTWQDRPYKGQHQVRKLRVVHVEQVCNTKVRKQYFDAVQQVQSQSMERDVVLAKLRSHEVDTSSLVPDLHLSVNEALMFHGSSPDGAAAILRSRVKVIGSGAAHGDLYGPGCYFADTVSKADTYSKRRDDGTCGIVISRVVLGNIFTTTERTPDVKDLLRKINSGDYDTICGDRRQIQGDFGGWMEFITFNEQRSLPLFLAWYRRV